MIDRRISDLAPGDMFYEFDCDDRFAKDLDASWPPSKKFQDNVSHQMLFKIDASRRSICVWVIVGVQHVRGTGAKGSSYMTFTAFNSVNGQIASARGVSFFLAGGDMMIEVISP